MSTTIYMSMELPTPSSTVGPEWADNLNAALEVVDSHDHTAGNGQQIPTAGINLDADLSLNGFEVQDTLAVQLNEQASAPSTPTDAGKVVNVNGDLWYINGDAVPVQITSGTSITSPSSPVLPPGVISAWGGVSAPTGYLLCDGTSYLVADYPNLWANIGYTFGGSGLNFNVPFANGRTLVGAGTYTDSVSGSVTRTLGQVLGAEKHVLTTAELATHTHIQNSHTHTANTRTWNNGGAIAGNNFTETDELQPGTNAALAPSLTQTGNTGINSTTATNQNAGSSSAHNNMQPSLVVNYIIKT